MITLLLFTVIFWRIWIIFFHLSNLISFLYLMAKSNLIAIILYSLWILTIKFLFIFFVMNFYLITSVFFNPLWNLFLFIYYLFNPFLYRSHFILLLIMVIFFSCFLKSTRAFQLLNFSHFTSTMDLKKNFQNQFYFQFNKLSVKLLIFTPFLNFQVLKLLMIILINLYQSCLYIME